MKALVVLWFVFLSALAITIQTGEKSDLTLIAMILSFMGAVVISVIAMKDNGFKGVYTNPPYSSESKY